jgi:hypothetical protein
MREELIKSIITYKLTMADKLIGRLPPEAGTRLRSFGKLVYDTVGEFRAGAPAAQKPQVNNVKID